VSISPTCLHAAFTHTDQKIIKRLSSHQCLFVLLGSLCSKAACKILVKSTLLGLCLFGSIDPSISEKGFLWENVIKLWVFLFTSIQIDFVNLKMIFHTKSRRKPKWENRFTLTLLLHFELRKIMALGKFSGMIIIFGKIW